MSLLRAFAVALALVVSYCFSVSAPAFAQSRNPATTPQEDHDQMLKQLLTEVHELRLVVQRAAVNNTRFQMLIERVRVEQAHVDSLGRELERVRAQIREMHAFKPSLEQQIKDAEDRLDRATDLNTHADLESRIKVMKADLARYPEEEEKLRSLERTRDGEFQASQARLNELNNQLDQLLTELKGP